MYKPREPNVRVELQDPSVASDLGFPPGADVVAYHPVPCEPFGFPELTWEDHGMVVDNPPGDWPSNVLRHPDGPDRTVQVWRRIIRDPSAGWSLVQSWRPDSDVSVSVHGLDTSSVEGATAHIAALRLLDTLRRSGRPPGRWDITNPDEIISAWRAVHQTEEVVTQQKVADHMHVSLETLQRSLKRFEVKWRQSGAPIK